MSAFAVTFQNEAHMLKVLENTRFFVGGQDEDGLQDVRLRGPRQCGGRIEIKQYQLNNQSLQ